MKPNIVPFSQLRMAMVMVMQLRRWMETLGNIHVKSLFSEWIWNNKGYQILEITCRESFVKHSPVPKNSGKEGRGSVLIKLNLHGTLPI